MSTNDDSASRRGRRADQGAPAWRNPNRQPRDEGWDQPSGNRDSGAPYSEQRGRDNQSQQASYSGFTRPSYSQRQEPAPPARPYDSPPQQPYYQDPAPRQDLPRYVDPAGPSYAPPPQSYDPPNLGYGDGGRDDLFAREPAPQDYDHNPYGASGSGYQQHYDQGLGRAPAADQDYYHREAPQSGDAYGSSRYFDERPQAPSQRPAAPPAQPYSSGGYDLHSGGQHDPYEQQSGYDQRYAAQESWHGDEQAYHGREEQGRQLLATHGDELDEDFFGDEDDYEHDELHSTPGRGRRKLVAAAVAAALVAGGGAYYLKASGGRDRGSPVIRADTRPAKEIPGNPGGKQFANGEKAIYERLRPDGTTQMATLGTAPIVPASATPSASQSSSLEDRIDDALKRAHRTGDTPGPGADQPTVVRSESYTPDGKRADGSRPVITPGISSVDSGLPYPFGNAPPSAGSAPFRTASAPPPAPQQQPQQQFASAATSASPPATPAAKGARAAARTAPVAAEPPAAPAPATAGGFYVSLKSAPDEKGIQRDLPALSDKYKSVLGEVQLTTKIADLGAKGVTYRAVAGPLGTMQEAKDLCQKIKGVGGDKACFVTN